MRIGDGAEIDVSWQVLARQSVGIFVAASLPCAVRICKIEIALQTRLSRLTSEWFASDGRQPTPRIQLNYNDAIKSLVAAGYGATLLPHEASTPSTRKPAN
ncbi:LysR substrate-binding domain-containing protein [Xanthomonas hortorum]|uniref:LysR substrate-binding domain-containing protein n=1 Tax=Xanthomonas hortorum TaxID=56454 RepID=UPI003CCF748F